MTSVDWLSKALPFLAESETRFCQCPPDTIFSPFLGRKALPGQEGEGGPDGSHGDWTKGFFSTLLVPLGMRESLAVDLPSAAA